MTHVSGNGNGDNGGQGPGGGNGASPNRHPASSPNSRALRCPLHRLSEVRRQEGIAADRRPAVGRDDVRGACARKTASRT